MVFSRCWNTLTFNCSQFFSILSLKHYFKKTYWHHVRYCDTEHPYTREAKSWITAQKTDQLFPSGCPSSWQTLTTQQPIWLWWTQREEKWLKPTMLTHSHATVHLFICAYSRKQMEFKELSQGWFLINDTFPS